jgi:L-arabinose isomerase
VGKKTHFRQADVDLVFLHVATYALSSTVLPVARRAKTPVIILNLTPGEAIDYAPLNQMRDRAEMTGEWLTHLVPELFSARNRQRFQPGAHVILPNHRHTPGRRHRVARN